MTSHNDDCQLNSLPALPLFEAIRDLSGPVDLTTGLAVEPVDWRSS
jgi:hypothetical protein